jgi:hypothetical protein
MWMQNSILQVMRRPIRFFVHPTAEVDATIRAQGLAWRSTRIAGPWHVVVYARPSHA